MGFKVILFVMASVSVIASGCSTLVSNDPSAANGPEGNVTGRTGVVVYNPHGLKELTDRRREGAFAKIKEFCGSNKYEVTEDKTVPRSEVEGVGDSLATAGATDLRRIAFKCK